MTQSEGEAALLLALRGLAPDLPQPEEQFRFGKNYRADFAYPEVMLLIEIDGGQFRFGGGKHGGDDDRRRTNIATALGYRFLRFSSQMVLSDPAYCVGAIRAALVALPKQKKNR